MLAFFKGELEHTSDSELPTITFFPQDLRHYVFLHKLHFLKISIVCITHVFGVCT